VDAAGAVAQPHADRQAAHGEQGGALLAFPRGEIGGADRCAVSVRDQVAQRDEALADRDGAAQREAVHGKETRDEPRQIAPAGVEAHDGTRVAATRHHVALDDHAPAQVFAQDRGVGRAALPRKAQPRAPGDDARPPSGRSVFFATGVDRARAVHAHLRAGEIASTPGIEIAHGAVEREVADERRLLEGCPGRGKRRPHPSGHPVGRTGEVERERSVPARHAEQAQAERVGERPGVFYAAAAHVERGADRGPQRREVGSAEIQQQARRRDARRRVPRRPRGYAARLDVHARRPAFGNDGGGGDGARVRLEASREQGRLERFGPCFAAGLQHPALDADVEPQRAFASAQRSAGCAREEIHAREAPVSRRLQVEQVGELARRDAARIERPEPQLDARLQALRHARRAPGERQRVALQLGGLHQHAPDRFQVEGACDARIALEVDAVDPHRSHAVGGDVLQPDREEVVTPVGEIVVGTFLGGGNGPETRDGRKSLEPLGRDPVLRDAPAQRERDAVRAHARGMEHAPRKLPEGDRGGDAVDVELPLDGPVLRRQPQAADVHAPRPR